MSISTEALQQLQPFPVTAERPRIALPTRRGVLSALRQQIELSRQRAELGRQAGAAALGRDTGVKC